MGNTRGNLYSTNHTIFNDPLHGSRHERKKFWQFTLHETGVYDLSVSIDYVLNQTEQMKLHFFGHSQGATSFFILAAEKPEYNDKIEMMHALGPAVFLTHIKSPFLQMLKPFVGSIHVIDQFSIFSRFKYSLCN